MIGKVCDGVLVTVRLGIVPIFLKRTRDVDWWEVWNWWTFPDILNDEHKNIVKLLPQKTSHLRKDGFEENGRVRIIQKFNIKNNYYETDGLHPSVANLIINWGKNRTFIHCETRVNFTDDGFHTFFEIPAMSNTINPWQDLKIFQITAVMGAVELACEVSILKDDWMLWEI